MEKKKFPTTPQNKSMGHIPMSKAQTSLSMINAPKKFAVFGGSS